MHRHPPIRTFQPRRRRLTPARQQLFDTEGPRWVIPAVGEPVDLGELFGRAAPVVLEIGIGRGEALLAMAAADPAVDVLGADVHTPGIAAAVAGITAAGLTNVRLVHGDLLEFADRLQPGALAGIRIFFPDPWPKASKRHKRLVSAPHLARLVPLLAPGGFVHMATDIADYAEQMVVVCMAHGELVGGPINRPDWRPETRYERKGIEAGRAVVDLWYERVTPRSSD